MQSIRRPCPYLRMAMVNKNGLCCTMQECEWYFTEGSKEDITYFGKPHSKEFSHRIEVKEEYENDANSYEVQESRIVSV